METLDLTEPKDEEVVEKILDDMHRMRAVDYVKGRIRIGTAIRRPVTFPKPHGFFGGWDS